MDLCHSSQRVALLYHGSELCFQGLKQSDPINRERQSRPISIQRPKRRFRIPLNCAKLKFVSYTSNLLEQTYDFPKHIMFLQKWILNLQDLLQNQSLETVPVCIVLQYYPHDNIVCIHMYDEYMKSIDSGVCHRLWYRASLFTDHRTSGLPIRAKYKHFRTIWEHTFDNSPTDFISSSLK